MHIHQLDPTILQLGPLEIRWYGLVYVLGFLLAVWWLNYLRQKNFHTLSKDEIWDFIFYLMLGVLIGSRFFMIFWDPQTYLLHPLNLLKIWQGGMSFHGGLAGIIIACWYYTKKKNLSFLSFADLLSAPAMFALALGRIANFINAELIGRPWNGSWCVVFPLEDNLCRHPNMIYSALQRLAVFSWLLYLTLQQKFTKGFIFWNFVFWEGVGRFLMDFFREDILYYGLSLGQWFSSIMVVVALIVFYQKYREDWKKIIFSSKSSKSPS